MNTKITYRVSPTTRKLIASGVLMAKQPVTKEVTVSRAMQWRSTKQHESSTHGDVEVVSIERLPIEQPPQSIFGGRRFARWANTRSDYRKQRTACRILKQLPANCRLVQIGAYSTESPAYESDIVCVLNDNGLYVPNEEDEAQLYVMPDYLSGGDYGNTGALGASNYRVFLYEFAGIGYSDDTVGDVTDCEVDPDVYLPEDGIIERSYGHGGYAIAIRLDVWLRRPDIRECINGLDNYPLIDDEDSSFVEMEWANENWDNWTKDDFVKALQKRFGEFELNELGESELRSYFEDWRESANEYWECEGGHGSMYVDLNRVVNKIESPTDQPKYGNCPALVDMVDNKYCDECQSFDCECEGE